MVNSGEYGEHRLFIVDFDPKAGKLEPDTRSRDPGSDRPGVSVDAKVWPHGFRGHAYAHGAVQTASLIPALILASSDLG